MTDLAVDDAEHEVLIHGVADLEQGMEKLMQVFIGYLKHLGFGPQWAEVAMRENTNRDVTL